jgi:hypothetical protein
MATKKDLTIAVLATFCLTATLFIIAPTSSAPARQYDPWLDYNGDGKIELKDVYAMYLAYGTSGDPTKNVNVTNWPQDRQLTVKKGIEKLVILDFIDGGSGNGYGLALGKPVFGDGDLARFVYDFEPKGVLINITDIYVNYIWRGDVAGSLSAPHIVWLVFWEHVPLGGAFDYVYLSEGIGTPYSTMPMGYCLRMGDSKPSFNYTLVKPGMNSLEISRGDQYGDHIYFFKLELFIEYYYRG